MKNSIIEMKLQEKMHENLASRVSHKTRAELILIAINFIGHFIRNIDASESAAWKITYAAYGFLGHQRKYHIRHFSNSFGGKSCTKFQNFLWMTSYNDVSEIKQAKLYIQNAK